MPELSAVAAAHLLAADAAVADAADWAVKRLERLRFTAP